MKLEERTFGTPCVLVSIWHKEKKRMFTRLLQCNTTLVFVVYAKFEYLKFRHIQQREQNNLPVQKGDTAYWTPPMYYTATPSSC